jgi:hypothetical protein
MPGSWFNDNQTPIPRPGSGRAGRALDHDEIATTVTTLVRDAIHFTDDELTPDRAAAAREFRGDPFGNEQKGRSAVVSTDVRDTILGILPSVMRIFAGPDRTVEAVPRNNSQVAAAEQATDYLQYVATEDNPGFAIHYGWWQDALLKRLGIVKWWWENVERTTTADLYDVTPEQLGLLQQEPGVEYEIEGEGSTTGLLDCRVTRSTSEGVARYMLVPPEEFLYSRGSRTIDQARMVGHRRVITVSEAFEAGVADWETLVEHAGPDASLELNDEEIARRSREETTHLDEDGNPLDEASLKILVVESFIRMDMAGDRRLRMYRFWSIGSSLHLVDSAGEEVEDRPFATFCPFPEPHAIVGQSMRDLTKDIQRIKSAVLRGNVDSLGLALMPRTWYVESQVNPKDLFNSELGAVIRVRSPGMLGEFTHSYVGKETYPLLEYMDSVKEQRTKQTKASNGLDADALQSSTKAAVAATLSGAQAGIELLARIFAESERTLFKGLYRLVKRHQNAARMVRLRGQFVEIDPRPWDEAMDFRITVALGAGATEDKIALLAMVKQDQDQLLAAMGPANPMVGLDQARYTRARILELSGRRDVDSFYKPITPEQVAQIEQQVTSTPPPPNPALAIAEAEMQIAREKMQMDAQKTMMEHQLKQEQMRQDFELKTRELELKYQTNIDQNQVRAEIEGHQDATKTDLETRRMEQTAALELHRIERQAEVQQEAARLNAVARTASQSSE